MHHFAFHGTKAYVEFACWGVVQNHVYCGAVVGIVFHYDIGIDYNPYGVGFVFLEVGEHFAQVGCRFLVGFGGEGVVGCNAFVPLAVGQGIDLPLVFARGVQFVKSVD